MKKGKRTDGRIYICSVCGKEIRGEHVMIRTRRHTELHIHYDCVSGKDRRNEQQGLEST